MDLKTVLARLSNPTVSIKNNRNGVTIKQVTLGDRNQRFRWELDRLLV